MSTVVGYIHATEDHSSSGAVQYELLTTYCEEYHLKMDRIYSDIENKTSAVETDLGITKLPKYKKRLAARRELLQEIKSGNVGIILVDSLIRLSVNASETPDLIPICEKQNIVIIEVKLERPLENIKQYCKTAVYHFTDGSMSRQKIVEKDIDSLYEEVSRHDTWTLQGLYLDRTLVKGKQIKYKEVTEKSYTYNVLLTKDFYHIETKTTTFWENVIDLMNRKVKIHTLLDGNLDFFNDPVWLSKKLKVAIYYRGSKTSGNNELRVKVLKTFAELKTNWNVENVYIDYMTKYSDKQPELIQLTLDADQYDLILVDRFGMIHYRTSMFMKMKHCLKIPVYSIKEGGILL